jgi:hypothetical protein
MRDQFLALTSFLIGIFFCYNGQQRISADCGMERVNIVDQVFA